ncbi:MAG: hypothetical protein R2754_12340 [Microthrixaceae bacterium]
MGKAFIVSMVEDHFTTVAVGGFPDPGRVDLLNLPRSAHERTPEPSPDEIVELIGSSSAPIRGTGRQFEIATGVA